MSQASTLSVPSEWRERFLLKRIEEKDLEISLEERNAVLVSLTKGTRFVQIRKYTLMLNSIKSIDPLWGDANIPPRPHEATETVVVDGKAQVKVLNQKELDLWDSLFKDRLLTGGSNG